MAILEVVFVTVLGILPADEEFQKALEATDPKDAAALLGLGIWCEGRGSESWAARCYKRAIGLGPGPAGTQATIRLARIEIEQKQFQRAYDRLRALPGASEIPEVREILTRAETEATRRQRGLVTKGQEAFDAFRYREARDAFVEAYRSAPPGESSADFVPPHVILLLIARSVDAIDDEHYRRTARPLVRSISRCKKCDKEGGFETCGRCGGKGTIKVTVGLAEFKRTTEQRCPRCNGLRWLLCSACRGTRHVIPSSRLSRAEKETLDDVIDKIRNVRTLKLPFEQAVRDVEDLVLGTEQAGALGFLRAIKAEYGRPAARKLREIVKAVPPPPGVLAAARGAWTSMESILDRSSFLTGYAIEYAQAARPFDCLRGARKRLDPATRPAAEGSATAAEGPEVLSAFPDARTEGWVIVRGTFGGYAEEQPAKGTVTVEGTVAHNVNFFVWLPSAKPALERLEKGPWKSRVQGLAAAYPFDLAERFKALPAGQQVTLVGRFLRDRLGFPRNWFEVWDCAGGMTASQEELFRMLEEPVELNDASVELSRLGKILRFFGVTVEFTRVDPAKAVACAAAGCPLGIFIDRLSKHLDVPWHCVPGRVVLGDAGPDEARRNLSVALSFLAKAFEKKGYTLEVGSPKVER